MWSYTAGHFKAFQRNIELRPEEHADALGKAERVARCLHSAYYQGEFHLGNLLISGSYGKATAIRPTSDIDLMYFLPVELFGRYSAYSSGGQSALLQDVRAALLETFSTTEIKADGQAIIVDYETRKFEVVPAFNLGGQIYIADTNAGGRWKPTNPIQEAQNLQQIDVATQGHLRALIKYLKTWKRAQEVPLRSIILEYAAFYFIQQWSHLQASFTTQFYGPIFWHDFLVRDFFRFLLQYNRLSLPHNEVILFGDGWQRKAQDALREAEQACYYEEHDQPLMAKSHWHNIFGGQFTPSSALERISLETILSSL